MNEYFLIIGMMLVTFSLRYPVLAFVSKVNLPEIIKKGLKYVPASVLTAIIVPAVFIKNNQYNLSFTNSYLVASIVAGLFAWKSKNLLLTIIIGMLIFWLWKTIFPV